MMVYSDPETKGYGYSGVLVHMEGDSARHPAVRISVSAASIGAGWAPAHIINRRMYVVSLMVGGDNILDWVIGDDPTVKRVRGYLSSEKAKKSGAAFFLRMCLESGHVSVYDIVSSAFEQGVREGKREQQAIVRQALGIED